MPRGANAPRKRKESEELEKLLSGTTAEQKRFFTARDPTRVLLSFHPNFRQQEIKADWIKYCFATGCKASLTWQRDAGGMWNGANVFHMGASTGITKKMMQLLQQVADQQHDPEPKGSSTLICAVTESYSWSVLHFAAKFGRHNEIRLFLQAEPLLPVNARDNEQRTPLHRAAMSPCCAQDWQKGVSGKDAASCVRALLEYNADPNAVCTVGAITEAESRLPSPQSQPTAAPPALTAVPPPAVAPEEDEEECWKTAPRQKLGSGRCSSTDSCSQKAAASAATTGDRRDSAETGGDRNWDTSSMRSAMPERSGCRTPFMDALMTITHDDRIPAEFESFKGVLHLLLEVTSRDLVQEALSCVLGRTNLVEVVARCGLHMYTDAKGRRVLLTNHLGTTPLMHCARNGDLDNVQRLMGACTDDDERSVLLDHRNAHDLTALHLALIHGSAPIVQSLLENKADPLGNGAADTPLERADCEIRCELLFFGSSGRLRALEQAKRCLVAMPNFNLRTVQSIFKGSNWFRLDEVWDVLQRTNDATAAADTSAAIFDVNQPITTLDTLLTFAVEQDLGYLQKLLQLRPPDSTHGVDVNCNFALHRFVDKQRLDLIEQLLQHGASVSMLDEDYTSALTISYELLDNPDDSQAGRDTALEIFIKLFSHADAQKPLDWEKLRKKIEAARRTNGENNKCRCGVELLDWYEGPPTSSSLADPILDDETKNRQQLWIERLNKVVRKLAKKDRQGKAVGDKLTRAKEALDRAKKPQCSPPDQWEAEMEAYMSRAGLEGELSGVCRTDAGAAPLVAAATPTSAATSLNESIKEEELRGQQICFAAPATTPTLLSDVLSTGAPPNHSTARRSPPLAPAPAQSPPADSILLPLVGAQPQPLGGSGQHSEVDGKELLNVNTSMPWKTTDMSYLFRGTHKGAEVVVKQWRKRDEHDTDGENSLQEELRFHQRLQNDSIMPLLDYIWHTIPAVTNNSSVQVEYQAPGTKVLWLVFPYYKNGDLAAWIKELSKQPEHQRREECSLRRIVETLYGIAKAMAYIKSRSRTRRAIHRDLKTENIFLDDDYRPRLADFGCAKEFDHTKRNTVGRAYTVHIRAPEQVRTSEGKALYNHKVDVFAFGHCIYELLALDRQRHGREGEIHLCHLIEWSNAWKKLQLEAATAVATEPSAAPSATLAQGSAPEDVAGLADLFSGRSLEKFRPIATEWFRSVDCGSVADCTEAEMDTKLIGTLMQAGMAETSAAHALLRKRLKELKDTASASDKDTASASDAQEKLKNELVLCKARCLPPQALLPYHLNEEHNPVVTMLLQTMNECFECDYNKRPEFTDIITRLEDFLRKPEHAHLLWRPTEITAFLVFTADYFHHGSGSFKLDKDYRLCQEKFSSMLTSKVAEVRALDLPWSFEKLNLPKELGRELELFSLHSRGGPAYDRHSVLELLIAVRNLHVHFYDMHKTGSYDPSRQLREVYHRRRFAYELGDKLCVLCRCVVDCVLQLRPPRFEPPVGGEMMHVVTGRSYEAVSARAGE